MLALWLASGDIIDHDSWPAKPLIVWRGAGLGFCPVVVVWASLDPIIIRNDRGTTAE
jgi:hypothetical protein